MSEKKLPVRVRNLIALAVIGFGVCLPLLGFDFIEVDERQHLLQNPYLHDLNGLFELWKHPYFGLYVPVTYSVWWIYTHLFGLNSFAFHLLNIVFHILNATLVYLLIEEFQNHRKEGHSPSLRSSISCLAAFIFLLHPIQASSVAWVSEFRGVLGTTFALLALLSSQKYVFHHKLKSIFASLTFCLLAMLSKPTFVIWPGFILLFCFFFLHPEKRRSTLAPLLLSASSATLFAFLLVSLTSDQQVDLHTGFSGLFSLMINNLGFYFSKIALPIHLTLDYGLTLNQMTRIHPGAFALTAIVWLAIPISSRLKKDFVWKSVFLFILTLLPVLGFLSFGFQYYNTVADRYLYISTFCLSLLVTLAIGGLSVKTVYGILVLYLAVAVPLFELNAHQYKNLKTLGLAMIKSNQNSFTGQTMVGQALLQERSFTESKDHLLKAIEIRPDYWTAHSKLGELLELQENWKESISHFMGIIENKERKFKTISAEFLAEAYLRVGFAYQHQGKIQEAKANYDLALHLDPQVLLRYKPILRETAGKAN